MDSSPDKAIAQFIDSEGRLKQFPAKRSKQILALNYLAAKLTPKKEYTEAEINELITQWHTFDDWCLIRRDMCDLGLLARTRDGKTYIAPQREA